MSREREAILLGNHLIFLYLNMITLTPQDFYPRKGLCKFDTQGCPIVFTYVLFCVRKRILDFKFTAGFLHF